MIEKNRKKFALVLIGTKFGPQEVESWTQSQGQFQFPAVDMLHATIFWKLRKMEGNAVKEFVAALAIRRYFWRQISTKNVPPNEFK